MYFLYNIAVHLLGFILKIAAIFNKKLDLFVKGRSSVFSKLKNGISKDDRVIWFHCASLGEFEQGRPVIEKFKKQVPGYKVLLTFFSPSGYEIMKNYEYADLICYLPLDTKKNARIFLELVHPEIAVFIKYEFWPNFLRRLANSNTKTVLVSGIFRKDQAFFKSYGQWMRKALKAFDHFFVQNEASRKLLQSIGHDNTTVAGDTRFDRVYQITRQDNHIEPLADFCKDSSVLVAGSTWEQGHEFLINYINGQANEEQKFIIAPHNIKAKEINEIKHRIEKETQLLSKSETADLSKARVMIIDSIGILSKAYAYADLAYVGGGFGSGIHNILEPASFGVPVIIGPEFKKFKEARELVKKEATLVVKNQTDFDKTLTSLFHDQKLRVHKARITQDYVRQNLGATNKIMAFLEALTHERANFKE